MKRILSFGQNTINKHKQFLTFALVGGFGTFVNTFIFWLLTTISTFHYTISAVIATEIAIISNFIGNHVFTFKHTTNEHSLAKKFILFQGVSMITLVGTVTILVALTQTFGEELVVLWNLAAIGLMFFANFGLNKMFTWGTHLPKPRLQFTQATRAISLALVVILAGLLVAGAARAETLTVYTTPVESDIYLNGTHQGTTNLTGQLDIAGLLGAYELLVTKTGYENHTENITIINGTNETVNVTLTEELTTQNASGIVNIETTPTGADIYVNGTLEGQAPLTLNLTEGTYDIEASLTGYENKTTQIILADGEEENVSLTLTALNGTLDVSTTPTGASITIDGDAHGTAPLTVSLAPGTYTVEASLTGYETTSIQSTIIAQQTTTENITLNATPQNATITIDSTPTGATVLIDSITIGTTPLVHETPAGTYNITITETGYESYEEILTVTEAENATVNATLTQLNTTLEANVTPENGTLYLNGVAHPVTGNSITITDVIPGTYNISYEATNHETYEEATVNFGAGETITRDITLTALNATLNVSVTPTNATITINGESITGSPAIFSLQPGTYTANITLADYDPSVEIVTLTANEYEELTIVMQEHQPTITSATTTLTDLTEFFETETHDFSITLDENDMITWTVDGQVVHEENNTNQSNYTWNPGIFYTSSEKTIDIVATTSSQQQTWTVTVVNVFNPFFADAEGATSAQPHVYTNNDAHVFDSLTITITTDGTETNEHELDPTTDGTETNWSKVVELPTGTSYITKIVAYELTTNTTYTHNLDDIIGYTITASASSSESEFKHEAERFSRGSSGSAGGSAYWIKVVEEELEMVYARFETIVLKEDGKQTISVDATIDRGEVSAAQALIEAPDGTNIILELELVEGDGKYGTWSADLDGFEIGKYTLKTVQLWGRNEEPQDFHVEEIAFWVEGEYEEYIPKELSLVYTALSLGMTTHEEPITLTLDAEDGIGVATVTAYVTSNREEDFTIELTRINGDANYGTWEVAIETLTPDTTYTVESITLSNGEEEKIIEIEDRTFYVQAVPYVPPKAGIAPNVLTGAIAADIFSPEWIDEMRKQPLVPTILAFAAMILIIAVAFSAAAIGNKLRRTQQA